MPFKHMPVLGGSFNPPTRAHIAMVEALARSYGGVIVVPCGPRPDKDNYIAPIHRAVMADLAFGHIPGVTVDLFDLEQDRFTRTWDLEERYAGEYCLHHVVGSDLIEGGLDGASDIQERWYRGREMWRRFSWIVFERDGYSIDERDLPLQAVVPQEQFPGSSTEARDAFYRGRIPEELVTPEIASYITRHGLYRGAPRIAAKHLEIEDPRPFIVTGPGVDLDRYGYRPFNFSPEEANCILVFGGDGTMLHAIRTHWRERLPFVGVNMGHAGFLLNDSPNLDALRHWVQALLTKKLSTVHAPLLYAETNQGEALAFNDVWLERSSGQAAALRVSVNGVLRMERLIADGILAATPSGSTAYANAMGARALPMNANAMILIGSNVMEPKWTWANLDIDSHIEIEVLEPNKRPVRAFADGVDLGIVRRLSVRMSRIAAAELAFDPERDMTAKRAARQFPPLIREGQYVERKSCRNG